MKVFLVTPVWGRDYVRTFLDISLPSLFAKEDFYYFSKNLKATYLIFTDTDTENVIRQSEIFKKLSLFLSVQFHSISKFKNTNKYIMSVNCHKEAVKIANRSSSPLFFICPDVIHSNGMLKKLIHYLKNGYRLIMTPGIRVSKEAFITQLLTLSRQKSSLSFSPRELISLGIPHLHPTSLATFWENDKINYWSSQIYWKLSSDAFLIHGFHMHPIAIWPKSKALPRIAIDGDYMVNACPDEKTWKIITDSDEFVCLEMSKQLDPLVLTLQKKEVLSVAKWAYRYAHPKHLEIFENRIVVHASDIQKDWHTTISESNVIVHEILKTIQKFGVKEYIQILRDKFIETSKAFIKTTIKIVLRYLISVFPILLRIKLLKRLKQNEHHQNA